MIPKSIRWRLPLSYATIVFLTTLILGGSMLTILQRYYTGQEIALLTENGIQFIALLETIPDTQNPPQELEEVVDLYANLAQARIRVFDSTSSILADSGDTEGVILIGDMEIPLISPIDFNELPPPIFRTKMPIFEEDLGLYFERISFVEGEPVSDVHEMTNEGQIYSFGVAPVGFWNRGQILSTMLPIFDESNEIEGYVELIKPPELGNQILRSVVRGWMIASGIAILIASIVGWLVSRRMINPLLDLNEATKVMSDGKFSVRANDSRQDEIGELAKSFNQMAGHVEEKVTTLQRFVGDAAHELNTPLTALRANLELLEDESDEDERQAFVEQAQGQVKRLIDLTGNLLSLSKIEGDISNNGFSQVDFRQLLLERSEFYASKADQQKIVFDLEVPDSAVLIQGNKEELGQAINNLLENALKYSAGVDSADKISVRLVTKDKTAVLKVQDHGIGILEEDLPHLLNRFHRGRNVGSYAGSGLGLAIVQATIQYHHGEVQIESDGLGQGTLVTVSLPLSV